MTLCYNILLRCKNICRGVSRTAPKSSLKHFVTKGNKLTFSSRLLLSQRALILYFALVIDTPLICHNYELLSALLKLLDGEGCPTEKISLRG